MEYLDLLKRLCPCAVEIEGCTFGWCEGIEIPLVAATTRTLQPAPSHCAINRIVIILVSAL